MAEGERQFFNAGDKIDEVIMFSISESSLGANSDDKSSKHSVGRWRLYAPAESWFAVPLEMDTGNETIRVNFSKDVYERFGKRGVVMLDPKHNPENEDPDRGLAFYAKAPTREAVELRAKALWQLYTRSIVDQHLADCQSALSVGGSPRGAVGFTAHCLKLNSISDPAEKYFKGLQDGKPLNGEIANIFAPILQQNQAMMAIVLAVATGQKVDPELLKNLITPTDAVIPAAVTSGIATGEIKKPLTDDQWDKHTKTPASKKERNEAAVKAL